MKPRPPLPAGGETPWDGGKRSVKERETGATPASRKSPVMDVSRQARVAWVSFGPRNGKTGAAWVSTNTQNSETGAAWVSTSPQNSTTRAAQVSTDAVGAAKRTGGGRRNGRTRPRGRHVPRHHPADPSPGVPIALEAPCPLVPSVDEVSHSPGMHTSLTPHGAARSSSRRVEVLILARLLDTPQEDQGAHAERPGACLPPPGRIHTLGD